MWQNRARAQTMSRTIFYPIVKVGASNAFGTPAIAALTILGVFLDEVGIFHEGMDAFKHGFTNRKCCAGVNQYTDGSDENAESGRDQPHSQEGIGHLLSAAVVAWNQGINLFIHGNNRLVTGFEYTAKCNLGYKVPYYPFKRECHGDCYPDGVSKINRANFSPIYEMTDHFHLANQSAQYCTMVYLQYAPEHTNQDHPGLGTLTFRREMLGIKSQTITFPQLPNKTVNEPDSQPGATASSFRPIVYSSSNPTVATITDESEIHLESGGFVTINASQLGDATYRAAPIASQTLMVTLTLCQRVEAQNFNAQSDVQTEITVDVDGDKNLSFFDAGDWTAYDALDFGAVGTITLDIRFAIRDAISTIQMRLGSPVGIIVGTCSLPAIRGCQNWKTNSFIISRVIGIQNVYFVYGCRVNLNWFRFGSTDPENNIE